MTCTNEDNVVTYLSHFDRIQMNKLKTPVSCFIKHCEESCVGCCYLFLSIMITCPCNEHHFTPHFYIVKLRLTRVYIFFLFLL